MGKEYTIPAKPTKYKGRNYRSRLEARVAAYFDLMGWAYEYEPEDLPSWSPDFLVQTKHAKCYVEVKPDNSMFEIKKYMVVDLNINPIILISPAYHILILEEGVHCLPMQNDARWIESANEVMFLKPTIN